MWMTPRTNFLHVPKTGGNWVLQACDSCGIDRVYSGMLHGIRIPYERRSCVTWCAVRHPALWLRSQWSYTLRWRREGRYRREGTRWVGDAAKWQGCLDGNAIRGMNRFTQDALGLREEGVSLDEFVGLYLRRQSGAISEIYRRYTRRVHAVAKNEFLATDSFRIMSLAGEPVDERWHKTDAANASPTDSEIDGRLLRQLAGCERAYRDYGYGVQP